MPIFVNACLDVVSVMACRFDLTPEWVSFGKNHEDRSLETIVDLPARGDPLDECIKNAKLKLE